MRWKVGLLAIIVFLGFCYACSVYRFRTQVIHIIDRRSNRPIPGVVVVAVWTRASFTLEEVGEDRAVRVYEATTGNDGVAVIPSAFALHAPWHFLSRKPVHIVVIKAGWMPAKSWDARWQKNTVLEPWDDSDQALDDLEALLNFYCEFKNWYKVSPNELSLYRRELVGWINHFPKPRAERIVRSACPNLFLPGA